MSKLQIFERTVDKIVADNSKVIAALQAENAKLQQERDELKRPIELGDRITFTKANLEAHNLEQQAKGLDKLAENMIPRGFLANTVCRDQVEQFANRLRNQAKGEG